MAEIGKIDPRKLRSRASIKGMLTRLASFIDGIGNDVDVFQLESRHRTLLELFSKFDFVQTEIEDELDGKLVKEQELERENFENIYYSLDGKFSELISERKARNEDSFRTGIIENLNGVKPFELPKIKLPTFNGDVTEYLSFCGRFDSLVHNRDDLTGINKLHYLKSCLTGEAMKIVESIAITEENYDYARELLKNRYYNVRYITQAHVKALFDMPEARNRSVDSLRELTDTCNRHLAALRGMGEPVDSWGTLLSYLVYSKLDFDTQRQYELHTSCQKNVSFGDLMEFLNKRCLALERVGNTRSKQVKSLTCILESPEPSKASSKPNLNCFFCKETHMIFKCPKFLSLSPRERFEKAKELKICLNCLAPNHIAKNCKRNPCWKCKKSHNSLLHFEALTATVGAEKVGPENDEQSNSRRSVNAGLHAEKSLLSTALLYTAMVKIRDRHGNYVLGRALIDSGAQISFITEKFMNRLGLKSSPVHVTVDCLGNKSEDMNKMVELELASTYNEFKTVFPALILSTISKDLPQTRLKNYECEFANNLKLADPRYLEPGHIDLLLSNDIFTKILKSKIIASESSSIKAIDTELGWIVGGLVMDAGVKNVSFVSLAAVVDEETVNDDLQRLWDLDCINLKDDSDEEKCQVLKSFERDFDGRFVVDLPFRTHNFDFVNSLRHAKFRFKLLERRFAKDSKYKQLYTEFIDDLIKCKYVEIIPEEHVNVKNCYYLPHHGVIKESSNTTKLRVVFDGTSAPAGCASLNSVLTCGDKQQNDLFDILIRFRMRRIAIAADIERMYCQINIQQKHRDFLRFLWKWEGNDQLVQLRLTSLPFGLNCSPYIAICCLKQLANEFKEVYPCASLAILHDSYVDDIICGADNEKEARSLVKDLNYICNSAGFNLRKWTSNSEYVLRDSTKHISDEFQFDGGLGSNKILGIVWNKINDCFSFNLKIKNENRVTKRSILAQLASWFDPLGWLCPITIGGKILLQTLWKLKLDWDAEIPIELKTKWLTYLTNISMVNSLKIPRYIGDAAEAILVGFADASEKAYGAVIYLICDGQSNILTAKTRVAPLKNISLARLELCGALLCAKLMTVTAKSLNIPLTRCRIGLDSQIALIWVSKPSYHWKAFVANRVSLIQSMVGDCQWFYVRSKANPADYLTRGILPAQLVKNLYWWHGPDNILDFEIWNGSSSDAQNVEEFRSHKVLLARVTMVEEFLDRISDYLKVVRVNAWICRFLYNIRVKKDERKCGEIQIDEFDNSLKDIIRLVQNRHFRTTIDKLADGKNENRHSQLSSLNCFLDQQGILRVGGRLSNSFLPYDAKHPVVLPKWDSFVSSLIKHEHEKNSHIGVSGLIAVLRQRYWIINIRSTVKRVLRKCIRCFRFCPMRSKQLMGDLPQERTENIRPFYNVGIDFCGPFLIRPTKKRGNTTQKCYVALFICMSVKAVHIEMVYDLTSSSFIASLRRFIARRGLPAKIMTDNGLNFVGADNLIREWYRILESEKFQNSVHNELLCDRIEWKFIPARSPNFGGLWESHIKCFKSSFYKITSGARLSIEEFHTLLNQIEASLNSRPLCEISDSINDLNVLTPGHFLIGTNLKSLPCPAMLDYSGDLNTRWRYVQEIFSQFWKRWSTEYLHSLNQRFKAKNKCENLKVNDLGVLVKEDCPPFKWPLCRIVETIPGKDGLVRVIKVTTGRSTFIRGVNKFCKFPNLK